MLHAFNSRTESSLCGIFSQQCKKLTGPQSHASCFHISRKDCPGVCLWFLWSSNLSLSQLHYSTDDTSMWLLNRAAASSTIWLWLSSVLDGVCMGTQQFSNSFMNESTLMKKSIPNHEIIRIHNLHYATMHVTLPHYKLATSCYHSFQTSTAIRRVTSAPSAIAWSLNIRHSFNGYPTLSAKDKFKRTPRPMAESESQSNLSYFSHFSFQVFQAFMKYLWHDLTSPNWSGSVVDTVTFKGNLANHYPAIPCRSVQTHSIWRYGNPQSTSLLVAPCCICSPSTIQTSVLLESWGGPCRIMWYVAFSIRKMTLDLPVTLEPIWPIQFQYS